IRTRCSILASYVAARLLLAETAELAAQLLFDEITDRSGCGLFFSRRLATATLLSTRRLSGSLCANVLHVEEQATLRHIEARHLPLHLVALLDLRTLGLFDILLRDEALDAVTQPNEDAIVHHADHLGIVENAAKRELGAHRGPGIVPKLFN